MAVVSDVQDGGQVAPSAGSHRDDLSLMAVHPPQLADLILLGSGLSQPLWVEDLSCVDPVLSPELGEALVGLRETTLFGALALIPMRVDLQRESGSPGDPSLKGGALPLARGAVIALFGAAHTFGPDERRLHELIGGVFGVTLERMRSLSDTRAGLIRQNDLSTMGRKIRRATGADAILRISVQELSLALGASRAEIRLDPQATRDVMGYLPADGSGGLHVVVASDAGVPSRAWVTDLGDGCCELCAPIVVEDRTLGSIVFEQDPGDEPWGTADAALVDHACEEIGQALGYVRHLEEMQSRTNYEHLGREIGERLRAGDGASLRLGGDGRGPDGASPRLYRDGNTAAMDVDRILRATLGELASALGATGTITLHAPDGRVTSAEGTGDEPRVGAATPGAQAGGSDADGAQPPTFDDDGSGPDGGVS